MGLEGCKFAAGIVSGNEMDGRISGVSLYGMDCRYGR